MHGCLLHTPRTTVTDLYKYLYNHTIVGDIEIWTTNCVNTDAGN